MSELRSLRDELAHIEGTLSRFEDGPDDFSMRMMRESLEERREQVTNELETAKRARLQVVFEGVPVAGHRMRIDALAQFLHALQESVSSVAQALTGKATSRAAIPGPLRDRTAFSFAEHFDGSFGVTLVGPGSVSPEGQEELEGFEDISTVLDDSVEILLDVLQLASSESVDDDPIIDAVLPLGSRSFKHLNDLAKSITDERMSARISWRERSGSTRDVQLTTPVASRLGDVLGRNQLSERQVEIDGHLGTVSDIRNQVELQTPEGRVIRARVIDELVPLLGDYYSRDVHATFDLTVLRSLVTGAERETYVLVGLAASETPESLPET